MHAALASTIVDLVMIPEALDQVDVEQPSQFCRHAAMLPALMAEVLKHVDQTLARKDFMVIAVAEGAGQKFVDSVNSHLKVSGGRSFYIDPSYIIRSVVIRPNDHIYCSRLARDAVHTAMRGYTGVCVGRGPYQISSL
ncbi:unnamed protein product [Cladocopium goreaui]|uniref:ATP-dependent 6-phosphofructokinase 5, chloroplastic (ATP-PFK 5) (Phosphofructokinase 5) (Phosphohexokinase 5) n=1 Tax=Cladocopium goreaui TaxID=2562237 RepID=A0A9P1DFC2_9DINO|nr:unnamed protein product [Cladocopium goreaui]